MTEYGLMLLDDGSVRLMARDEYRYWMLNMLPFGWMILSVPKEWRYE